MAAMFSVETADEAQRVAADLAGRGNRRRLRVFLAAFAAVQIAGLAFVYSRPAEYRAQATIAVKPAVADTALPTTGAPPPATDGALQVEAALLSSRPLVETALASLQAQGVALPEFGVDPAAGVQAALAVEAVAGSALIRLTASGTRPEHLAAILNTLIDTYSRQTVARHAGSASTESGALRRELADVDRRLAEKRRALEGFRQASDIVSGDRDENRVLAQVKGQSASLNLANEKVAIAEGRVRSLRESLAAGKAVVRARDNPTLAALEARASQLREWLRELERSYTPQFMEMDPDARGVRSRLADLERQIAEQRTSSGQTALAEAEEELAAARRSQQRLQQQIAEERGAVHAFSRRFATFTSMQEELAQLEAGRRDLSERLLRSETGERSRSPVVEIVEAAAVPREVWRPDYGRDAGISVAAALVAGLLAMALVELFNRPPARSAAPLIVTPPWLTVGALHDVSPALPGVASAVLPRPAAPALPAAAADPPRELSQPEVAGLLRALGEDDRVWASLLLCGATAEEIAAITAADLDRGAAGIRLSGPGARCLRVPAVVLERIAAAGGAAALMPHADAERQRRLLCAAHDAGLDDPAAVTPETLRHTCIAYLVRQGVRFGELDRIVGALPAEALARYAAFSPTGVRRAAAEVEPLMPALKALDPA